ncbi:hypothetical protein E1A91_A03G170300v1 [Gossypium mustelinum]|uniref:Uncharacterized protein n=3 Tax=Gossypium TaxID=3633 RepID=A0A5D2ZX13_GOSMU|nr:hypothetical protein ES332_A03G184600v1 [Gossypium tomentosum]TYJ43697.1 hypothetical protein E1A91_A03G170300v1 [Gossypium mustelinum]
MDFFNETRPLPELRIPTGAMELFEGRESLFSKKTTVVCLLESRLPMSTIPTPLVFSFKFEAIWCTTGSSSALKASPSLACSVAISAAARS